MSNPRGGMESLGHLLEVFAQRPLREVGVECRMGVGLTHQDEWQAVRNQYLTDRLGRVEIIPQDRALVGPVSRRMLVQPAFGSGVLTVLLVMAILRHDKLGRERNDLILVWGHDHRGEHPMGIGGGAIAMGLVRTLRTGEGLGAEILGAIQDY